MGNEELFRSRLQRLRGDRLRGASELARQALEDVATFVELCEVADVADLVDQAKALAGRLEATRPSMVSVAGLLSRWRWQIDPVDDGSLARARERLSASARALIAASHAAVEAVAEETAALVPVGTCVMTLSRSSTIVATFRQLVTKGVTVLASESRPLFEGHLLAAELDGLGIPVQLITEAQLGHFVAQADVALVGADAVLADGSLINKAGTYLLALAAREADVPFWVCCESFKRSHLGLSEFPLEEMDGSALGAPDLEHVSARNVLFDITPARLVTRWIDERGSTVGRPR